MDADHKVPTESVWDLFGTSQSAITAVEDLVTEADSGMEASVESLVDNATPVDGCNEPGAPKDPRENIPCYVSRTVQSDGSAYVRMFLLGKFLKHTSVYLGILEALTEKDTVDVLIEAEVAGPERIWADNYRSLLSGLQRCKAHVITRAGTLMSMPRIALWLSGDTVTISPIGWIRMQQLQGAGIGDVADAQAALKHSLDTWHVFKEFVAKRGLFTTEEMQNMYDARSILELHGSALRERVAAINSKTV